MTRKIYLVLFWALLILFALGSISWTLISGDDSMYLVRYIGNIVLICITLLGVGLEVWLFEKAYPKVAKKYFEDPDYDE